MQRRAGGHEGHDHDAWDFATTTFINETTAAHFRPIATMNKPKRVGIGPHENCADGFGRVAGRRGFRVPPRTADGRDKLRHRTARGTGRGDRINTNCRKRGLRSSLRRDGTGMSTRSPSAQKPTTCRPSASPRIGGHLRLMYLLKKCTASRGMLLSPSGVSGPPRPQRRLAPHGFAIISARLPPVARWRRSATRRDELAGAKAFRWRCRLWIGSLPDAGPRRARPSHDGPGDWRRRRRTTTRRRARQD